MPSPPNPMVVPSQPAARPPQTNFRQDPRRAPAAPVPGRPPPSSPARPQQPAVSPQLQKKTKEANLALVFGGACLALATLNLVLLLTVETFGFIKFGVVAGFVAAVGGLVVGIPLSKAGLRGPAARAFAGAGLGLAGIGLYVVGWFMAPGF